MLRMFRTFSLTLCLGLSWYICRKQNRRLRRDHIYGKCQLKKCHGCAHFSLCLFCHLWECNQKWSLHQTYAYSHVILKLKTSQWCVSLLQWNEIHSAHSLNSWCICCEHAVMWPGDKQEYKRMCHKSRENNTCPVPNNEKTKHPEFGPYLLISIPVPSAGPDHVMCLAELWLWKLRFIFGTYTWSLEPCGEIKAYCFIKIDR